MENYTFYNRDLSWLSFNERVLMEAESDAVPLLERIKFLSIYSSNLDEFYRVRMPLLMAIDNFDDRTGLYNTYYKAQYLINQQQERFGHLLKNSILPALKTENIHWLYNEGIPPEIEDEVASIFYNEVLAFLKVFSVNHENERFFAENNKLYLAVMLSDGQSSERLQLITIPSDALPRLLSISARNKNYVIFLDDIIRHNLSYLFPGEKIVGTYHIKITRNAEINLEDEIEGDITIALEKELRRRDFGIATRFLVQPNIPLRHLYRIIYALNLSNASVVQGGYYHNLKDLGNFPIENHKLSNDKWPACKSVMLTSKETLFERLLRMDLMVHVPYQKYDPVLRFFNEAASDSYVDEIYVTLYRVADNSRIVNALMTAANNGKKVSVMVELKARFDEANNIKWASRMKAAGVRIIYSSIDMKVHAKVALVKRTVRNETQYLGLLATGNLNETTAKFYTDHILLTSRQDMLQELQILFGFLEKKRKRPQPEDQIVFSHLLVAQFNLQQKFLDLIDREINNAKKGLAARIIIKMNNLEERILIAKLYEASNAGVAISLLIRGICCLIPGKPGQSENITIKRIVDRYLEHGRIFVFHNNGTEDVFMGSADWMNRNIYSRIEVCFPIYDNSLKQNLIEILNIQLQDTSKAVELNEELQNHYHGSDFGLRSQLEIHNILKSKTVEMSGSI